MICKKCGKEIDDASKFCEHCGSKANVEKKGRFKKISVIVIVIVLILSPYFSRILFAKIAQNNLESMKANTDCSYTLYWYDDYIDANITGGYLKPTILKFTDLSARLYICNENSTLADMGSSYYEFWDIPQIDKSNVYISTENGSYVFEESKATYTSDNIDEYNSFEEGTIYRCYLQLTISPKKENYGSFYPIIKDIDYALGQYGVYYTFSSDFIYENGQFIKVG